MFQVAHFYNTIDKQMVSCQQSIMLDTALAFEKLVKNPNSTSKTSGNQTQVTWGDPKEVEMYINKLQIVAEKLTTDNRKLRKCHTTMIEKVCFTAVLLIRVNHASLQMPFCAFPNIIGEFFKISMKSL